jgi:hypothetical protein
MNKSESIASLSKALVLAQSEFPRVAFNSTNPYFNSNYADLGAVIETSKPILKSHGLAVSQLVEGAAGEVGITTLLIHESGEYISSCVTILVDGKNLAQEAGKSITYLRRYALAAILGLYADQDNDGNDSAHKEQKSPEKKTESHAPASLSDETLYDCMNLKVIQLFAKAWNVENGAAAGEVAKLKESGKITGKMSLAQYQKLADGVE